MNVDHNHSLKHNLVVNLFDGGFFGFAMGFASFVTVIPLFVSTMTSSAILIGLIPAIHSVGWQLPQLFTVKRVASQTRYKPMVLLMTINERLPFVGLALVAFFLPVLGNHLALLLTFGLLIWQGLGGGFTATAWQSMIGKIIPSDRRGTFFGAQSAAANGLASLGAVLAGFILGKLVSPQDFGLCFLLASLMMGVSWFFLAQTREEQSAPLDMFPNAGSLWKNLGSILRRDRNFRWFLVARMLSQIAIMGFAFYTVYAVQEHGMSEVSIGLMTGILLATQIFVNPILGWIGDNWSHRNAMVVGIIASIASALLAWWAPSAAWFYPIFILAGIGNAAVWTVSLAMVFEFGLESERPAYIGLANTLIAPFTILAPLLGGWLAEFAGYGMAFVTSAIGGLVTLFVLLIWVRDERQEVSASPEVLSTD